MPPPKFHWVLLFVTTLYITGLGWFTLGGESTRSQMLPDTSTETVVLQLQWKHQFQFAGYYAAQALGYYQQAGLEVKIQEADTDLDSTEVVLQGKADFGITNSNLVLKRGQGEPVVVLASIYQHSPLILLSNQASGIRHVHDLVGKPVMLEPHATELIAYLEQEGISLNQMIRVPHSFDPQALIEGEVVAMSAYATDEPFLLRQAGLDYLIFTPQSGGVDFYGDSLFTTEQQIREHPQRVRGFLDASLKGWQYALDHPEEIIDLIYRDYSQRHSYEHLRFEAEVTKGLVMPDVVEIGYINPGRWDYIAQVYESLGLLSLHGHNHLQGFIYDRNPKPNMIALYLSFGVAIALVTLVTSIALYFYRLNLKIRKEIAERIQTEKNLKNLENRYRILVENAPFTVIISEVDSGKILYANQRAAEQFRMMKDYLVGQSTQNFYIHKSDRQHLVKTIKCQGFVDCHEMELKTAKDDSFWANVSITIVEFEGQEALFTSLVEITQQKQLTQRLETLAMTDELTQLYNRRFFLDRAQEEFQRWQRYQTPLCLLLIDVDHFKQINDTYGHDVGDLVLHHLAQSLDHEVRNVDIVARYGGEEFGILLPHTEVSLAQEIAERIRSFVATQRIYSSDQAIKITVSIGVAQVQGMMKDLRELLKAVDEALYEAKEQGRNRVQVSEV